MTTILEVAKKAGVAKSTVSRVLSGNGYVSQETKDRVFKAIAESGYRPNLLARNLAAQKSQTIGLVITNTLYHGTYFSELGRVRQGGVNSVTAFRSGNVPVMR